MRFKKAMPLVSLFLLLLVGRARADDRVTNSDFTARAAGGGPAGYTLTGSAKYGYLGDSKKDMSGWGAVLASAGREGAVSQVVMHLSAEHAKAYRFSFHGLPQDGFAVNADDLYMRVEFFGADGRTQYDAKEKKLYPIVQKARRDLSINGVRRVGGAAVWGTYWLDFELPFPQVDQVRLTVGFGHGAGRSASNSNFLVTRFSLVPIAAPSQTQADSAAALATNLSHLIPLGGRWFYAARTTETAAPQEFDYRNADRLIYHDDRYSAAFAGMMTSVLRVGEMDLSGNVVRQDRLVRDNVTLRFNHDTLIIHTHGLPNHPTGRFPENGLGIGFNPNYIEEQDETFYIPLNPKENPRHLVTTKNNSNHALPMGPIGVAVNGVVFFNPFDMGNQDATDMMDRCCGHPNQDGLYHYHKYPICVNSPWSDTGTGHSPLLGFAFDGYPIYGPYEKPNVMAKDLTGDDALNAFNMHYDPQRGWHYHVTPGTFPYLIGGYWGSEDPRDKHGPRRGPRGRGFGGPGFGPPGEPPGPPAF
ncbi:MAG TPA: YHYH protein [Tepidisphaeraceae bacterium]|nr:YHYH protein [Tepidisphaeraceae bacterium]